MSAENQDTTQAGTPRTKIFGVGNAGIAIAEQMVRGAFAQAQFAVVNTEASSLAASGVAEKILLEKKMLRGLGTGGDPELGRAAAEEHFQKLKDACAGSDVVFIVCGLGGGAGTGVSAVLARAARETGALVLGFVTLPFDCEGNRRQRQASDGLQHLKAAADGVICLPNTKIFQLIDENTSVLDTFQTTRRLLIEGVNGVWQLLTRRGLIEIHFGELCSLLRERHSQSVFASVEAVGETRAIAAADNLLGHPLLDGGRALAEADTVVVSIIGGPDLMMADVNRVMEQINKRAANSRVVMGAAVDEAFDGKISVTVIATSRITVPAAPAVAKESAPKTEEMAGEFFGGEPAPVSSQRGGASASVLTLEQREVAVARGARRKSKSRMNQGQLALNIVSKGRFEKTEPTVRNGEDLDLPTYVRRGVQFN